MRILKYSRRHAYVCLMLTTSDLMPARGVHRFKTNKSFLAYVHMCVFVSVFGGRTQSSRLRSLNETTHFGCAYAPSVYDFIQ